MKLGAAGVARLLHSGVNDIGGTLMNESISRAAGTEHGQEFKPQAIESLVSSLGRIPEQRTTLYGPVPKERREASFRAASLKELVQTPFQSKPAALSPH